MRVILLDNIRGIGQVGDIKEVSDGYARNFLFPRHKARPASGGVAKDIEGLKAKKLEARALAHAQAEELAIKLSAMTITLQRKTNPKGKLFSGITATDIAEAVSNEAGIHITPDAIALDLPRRQAGGHIKTIGDHTVRIKLSDGLTADMKVTVTAIS